MSGPRARRVAALVVLLAACAGAPPPEEKPPAVVAAPAPAELDSDCDKVADRDDRCPDAPEDRDSFQDQDGCPDPDNDGDGILDACDQCPNDVENYNGFEDEDGCVDRPRVKITENKIIIIQYVHFERGKIDPLPAAKVLLDEISNVMKDHPEIQRVAVVGHTSSDEPNGDRLSEARARKVGEMLVALGVEPGRLETHGVGPRQPLGPEPKEREKNRRVEFLPVQIDGRGINRWNDGKYVHVDPPPEPPPAPRPYKEPCKPPPPPAKPAAPCRM